ncbi:MAG: hypothetical protein WKF37_10745 [Bryobacteraceae bacterium]
MDLWQAIESLYVEKQKLDKAIATLEALKDGTTLSESQGRRGLNGMSETERREVSERMRNYWATRRKTMG